MEYLLEGLEEYPNANLAILIEGFTVVDIDDRSKIGWFLKFKPPQTRCIISGRGRHYYFADQLSFNPKKITDVEIKKSGLITVPPSQHKTGMFYRRDDHD